MCIRDRCVLNPVTGSKQSYAGTQIFGPRSIELRDFTCRTMAAAKFSLVGFHAEEHFREGVNPSFLRMLERSLYTIIIEPVIVHKQGAVYLTQAISIVMDKGTCLLYTS